MEMTECEWALSSACDAEDGAGIRGLTAVQEQQWREQGFVLVDGLLEGALVERAARELGELYDPATHPEEAAAARQRRDFGGLDFPFGIEALNEIAIHHSLLEAAERLLRSEVRLTQADAWAKFGREQNVAVNKFDNLDQRVHIDGWNHSLVVPPDWHAPASVAMIVYLSDVAVSGGATRVVPRLGPDDPAYQEGAVMQTPGCGEVRFVLNPSLFLSLSFSLSLSLSRQKCKFDSRNWAQYNF